MNTPPRPAAPQPPRYSGPRPPGAPPRRGSSRPSSGGGGGVVVALLLLAGAACGGYYYFKKPTPTPVVVVAPAPVKVEKPVPTLPKPEPEIKPVVAAPTPKPEPKPELVPMPKKEEPVAVFTPGPSVDEKKLAALFEGVLPLDERGASTTAAQERAKAAQDAALGQNKWAEWAALLRRSLLATMKSMGANSMTPQGLATLEKNQVFTLALDQAAFVSSVPAKALTAISKQSERNPFYRWLLANPAALESWLLTFRPGFDKAGEALDEWSALAKEDAAAMGKYRELALACALVFEEPQTFQWNEEPMKVTAAERYAYYTRHAAKGDLAVNPDKLMARDLVWVVGAQVPESEMDWALQKLHLRQKTWGGAYDMVKYDMERAVKGTNKYDSYTFSEILKKGGICGDRAYFSANTARAVGIPAAEISGDGSRGGHAWIGWMTAENEWKFSGRYAGYPLGHTRNPQTGKSESEQEIVRKSNRAESTEGLLKGMRAVWLAQAMEAENSLDIAALLFDGASTLGDKLPEVWQAKLAFWSAHRAEAPVEQWHTFMEALKRNMKEDPDMLAESRAAEEKFVFPRQNTKLAMADLKKDARRLEKADGKTAVDQADQIAKVIKQQAEVLQKNGPLEPIRSLYDKSYREHGKNPAVFKKLVKDCWSFVKSDNDVAAKACRDMESSFRRFVNSGGDYFDVTSQMSALKEIGDCYREIGLDKKADTLAKDVGKANDKAAKRAL